MAHVNIDSDGHIYFEQDPDEILDYRINWSEYVQGQTITSSSVIVEGSTIVIGNGSNGAAAPSLTSGSDHLAWVAGTYYDKGSGVVPNSPNGFSYENIRAGKSGSSEPVWPTAPGQVVKDGDCVWKCHKNFTFVTIWVVGSSSSTGLITNRIKTSGSEVKEKTFRVKIQNSKG